MKKINYTKAKNQESESYLAPHKNMEYGSDLISTVFSIAIRL